MITTQYWHYADPHAQLRLILTELRVAKTDHEHLLALVEPLRVKNPDHYTHSVRVALLAEEIAWETGLDRKAMLFSGLLHDAGKALVPAATLNKTDGWTPQDAETMRPHPEDGYRLARDRFDMSAEILVRHHCFQRAPYPSTPPPFLHKYGPGTTAVIPYLSRVLALADTFDALHRVNPTKLSGEEIRRKLEASCQDILPLVHTLYRKEVLREHDK